jgi:leishmanolysin-like peptidase
MDKCDKPKTVAYAAVCQQEMNADRPIAGFLNICPDKISNMTKQGNRHELLATFKHEIFHALGFSPSLYAFYRNSSGDPLTERQGGGLPEYDNHTKMYKPSEKVIKYRYF